MGKAVPYVEFDRVTLARAGKPLFEGFSLGLSEARVGLIGDNGSGKSTLLRLIAGLILPDSGDVRLSGPGEGRPGFLFQNPDHQILFPTVGEEVSFGLIEGGMDPKTANAEAAKLLAAHGCAGWEKRAVHELSEGQKQLVCLIAVLAPEPNLLLLDEPFAALDLPTRYDIRERLSQLKQNIIMASHDIDLLSEFDRVIWLEQGRVRGDGPPKSVLAAYLAKARAGTEKARTA
ncbi:cobalt ABC transporter [Terrihabitans soli]|uniref:Cobalt ABC transporter n=1 Tax=Terrihabitans soli TaxID=708113 RepID=A0A6S6QJM1_9HYPH|nr:ABC transporter ATP-binding protein [Terrihabitans soli]BCJ91483.1 cobalt ABC transporter [Terrihabitans soli]